MPSGVVLIAGCDLACQSCETWQFSLERRGAVRTTPEQLAALLPDHHLELNPQAAASIRIRLRDVPR